MVEEQPKKYLIRFGRGAHSYYLVNKWQLFIGRLGLLTFIGLMSLCFLCKNFASSFGFWAIGATVLLGMAFDWSLPDPLTQEELAKYQDHLNLRKIIGVTGSILLLPLIVGIIGMSTVSFKNWPAFIGSNQTFVVWYCKYCRSELNSCGVNMTPLLQKQP